ncbi:MAG TPA: SprT-like domain-containing protein [Solirubrobacterales bacterium]|nr:SprT-like domain-containing protein [Solirubrobacterales bacterium]
MRGRTTAAPEAPRRRFEVAGLEVRREADRLRELPVFSGGRLAREAPAIKVRRASRRPNRLGFAVPDEWRISITAYPGIRLGDVEETLLHELVHLHVGVEPGHRRWHGAQFRDTLRRAMSEAYGIDGLAPRSSRHGVYADALEARRARALASGGEQLALALG